MTVTKLDNSSCWTNYRVEIGEEKADLHVWAIVGGVLAVSYLDYHFTERFNYCAERDSAINPNWLKWGGVPVDLLAGGEATLEAFVRRNNHLHRLQLLRQEQQPKAQKSRRFHWESDRSYFRVYWEPAHYVTHLHIRAVDRESYSMWVGGKYAPATTNAIETAARVIQTIHDSLDDYTGHKLCYLSQEQFDMYCAAALEVGKS